MKALITGAAGQLGRNLQRVAPRGVKLVACTHAELDITDERSVNEVVGRERPDWVINAAAYTRVDQAELERDLAFSVNAEAPRILAEAVDRYGGRLLHVSTDFVFSGEQCRPYRPDDSIGPINVYGESKAVGEQAVCKTLAARSLILRTAWLYDSKGHNFVTTMLKLMNERAELTVVDDQVGTPTDARGLAEAAWACIERDLEGIYHWTDAGVASWYDFAHAIRVIGSEAGLIGSPPAIRPIPSIRFPTRARRPAFSVLDKAKTWETLGLVPTHWRDALERCLRGHA